MQKLLQKKFYISANSRNYTEKIPLAQSTPWEKCRLHPLIYTFTTRNLSTEFGGLVSRNKV